MCDQMAIDLLAANVFGSSLNVTLNTPLETYCNDLKSDTIRFSEFCLFPSQDNLAPICAAVENLPQDNIFNKLQSGFVTTLDQLPVLWESPLSLGNNTISEWIEVESKNVADGVFIQGTHLMSLPFFIVSDNRVILGKTSKYGTANSFYMSSLLDQVLYPVSIPGANLILGTNPLMTISADGNVRVIGPYVWTTLTNGWVLIPEIALYNQINGLQTITSNGITYIIWFGSTTIINKPCCIDIFSTINGATTALTLENHIDLDSSYDGQRGFLTVQSNYFVFGYSRRASLGFYVCARLITSPQVEAFTLWMNDADIAPLDSHISDKPGGIVAAAYGFAPSSSLFVLYLSTEAYNSQIDGVTYLQYRWNGDFTTNSKNVFSAFTTLTCTPDGSCIAYTSFRSGYDGGVMTLVRNGTQEHIIYNPLDLEARSGGTRFTFWKRPLQVASTYSLLYCDGIFKKFYYSVISNDPSSAPGPFDTTSYVYSCIVPVSDLGSPSMRAEYNQGPSWFFGSKDALGIAGVGAVSWHNRYRFKFALISQPLLLGPTGYKIERHNDYLSLQNATEIRLYDNGNLQAINGETVVWENAMSDGFGSSVDFVVVNKVRPSVSLGGNYLIYWTGQKTFRQCYYPYNSSRFTDYCKFNATGFKNALNQQANFCFSNLELDPVSKTNIVFADKRCTCIGGERLFAALFVNTEDMIPSQRSILLDYQPCMMVDCSESRGNGDPTNVARLILLEGKCVTQITICSTVIRAEDAASLGKVNIDQNCGGGNVPSPTCTVSSDCPIGTVCVSGICKVACTSTESCFNSGFTNHTCVNGGCVSNAATAGLSIGAISGIAVGVILAIALVSVLCWYFLIYKKTHPPKK